MITFADWLPPMIVGTVFTLVGCLKLYGLYHGIVGGPGQPLACRLYGT